MSDSVDGDEIARSDGMPTSQRRPTALGVEAFAGLSIGLPDRMRILAEHSGEIVLHPSRFQPEHTLVAALGGIGQNPPTDPVTLESLADNPPTTKRVQR